MDARTFFFYGTLMDADVLAAVAGRRAAVAPRRPARLDGYRRVFRAGASYPILLPDPAGRVDGIVVAGLDRTAVARLVVFEGGDYAIADVTVTPRHAAPVRADVFMPRPEVTAAAEARGAEAWEYDGWRRRHKPRYLLRLRGFGPGTPD